MIFIIILDVPFVEYRTWKILANNEEDARQYVESTDFYKDNKEYNLNILVINLSNCEEINLIRKDNNKL